LSIAWRLGGCHLVECKDLDEAMSIAMRLPSLRVGGSIEVRPTEPTPEIDRVIATTEEPAPGAGRRPIATCSRPRPGD